ncbi:MULTISPECIES: ubiquinone anaerobic biosynthesis protein UbiU [Kordiimonas]|jgi:putative protease|uniref:ubiquinone anaerobic biosynthesis protein UbiU n=1 Tax=Kordiimonas TaxID=288021 RepID=UPI00257FF371|nr:peptidase U32 family protein [Kordiimonas sp. UBA4487]
MTKLELICPAGTPAALRVAVDAGADAVYMGFRDETNARNFPGLNFSRDELGEALAYAHARGSQVFLAVNTYARAGDPAPWHAAIRSASELGVDALILADIGLLDYACANFPDLRLHLSVQASASNPSAINYYQDRFDIKRVVLPRVLTVPEIGRLNADINVETEVFAFGGMCPMAEGRCTLSSYITGKSPNQNGVCSPASHVAYERTEEGLTSKLGGFTINRFADDENAGYPTLCKGRFKTGDNARYLFEEPTSLDITPILPDLQAAGVTALKIEGRQRSKAYVRDVVTAFRAAIDGTPGTAAGVSHLTEGNRNTTGAYGKKWL